MRKSLLDTLVDPVSKMPLQAEVLEQGAADSILEGRLFSSDGSSYPVTKGIPRFLIATDRDQNQTGNSFGFKWQQRNTYDSPAMHETAQRWLIQRYGFGSAEEMRSFFSTRHLILDAGCGSGFSASLWLQAAWGSGSWVGADISEAIDVAQERLGSIENTNFLQADLLQLPFREETFDTIFSEGVLHHTPSTERAFKALVPLLEPRGELMFYVYRKKGPVREFTDDYIREELSSLPPEEAWSALRPLTRLAQALSELRAEVEIPEAIPYLGIKAGKQDVQRLIYWHFTKLFWNESLSFEENNHVNFDWYHPRYAHRQTAGEIRNWCEEAKLSIIHFDEQESGYTVRAIKN